MEKKRITGSNRDISSYLPWKKWEQKLGPRELHRFKESLERLEVKHSPPVEKAKPFLDAIQSLLELEKQIEEPDFEQLERERKAAWALATAKHPQSWEAEAQMVRWGFNPPRWTSFVDCKECGAVPADPDLYPEKQELVGCPWCFGFSEEPPAEIFESVSKP